MPFGKKLRKQISDSFLKINSPVELLLFSSGRYPKVDEQIEAALKEISSLSQKLSFKMYNLGSPEAKKAEVTQGPAIVLRGKEKGRIRFLGFPSEKEFPVFVMDILQVSGVKQNISENIVKQAAQMPKTKTHIEVFEIPSCAYSPIAVKLAHDLAMLNPNVTADMVDILLFPGLVRKYSIKDTPTTVINGKIKIEGIQPLSKLLDILKKY